MNKTDVTAAFEQSSFLYGGNAKFVEDLFQQYLNDPASVDPNWRVFFRGLDENAKSASGPSWQRPDWPVKPNDEIKTPIEIYPIPADNYFVVEVAGAESCNYTLLSANGNKMPIDVHTGIDEVLIKIADLPAGLYILQMDAGDTRSYSRIIVN